MATRNISQQSTFRYTEALDVIQQPSPNLTTQPVEQRNEIADFLGLVQRSGQAFTELQKVYTPENAKKAARAHMLGLEKPEPEGLLNTGKGMETYNIRDGFVKANKVLDVMKQRLEEQKFYRDDVQLVMKDGRQVFDSTNVSKRFEGDYQSIMAQVFGDTLQDPYVIEGAEAALSRGKVALESVLLQKVADVAAEKVLVREGEMAKSIFSTSTATDDEINSKIIKQRLDNMHEFLGKQDISSGLVDRDTLSRNKILVAGEYIFNSLVRKDNNGRIVAFDTTKAGQIINALMEKDGAGVSWYDVKDSEGRYKFRDMIDNIIKQSDAIATSVESLASSKYKNMQNEVYVKLLTSINKDELTNDAYLTENLEEGLITSTQYTSLKEAMKKRREGEDRAPTLLELDIKHKALAFVKKGNKVKDLDSEVLAILDVKDIQELFEAEGEAYDAARGRAEDIVSKKIKGIAPLLAVDAVEYFNDLIDVDNYSVEKAKNETLTRFGSGIDILETKMSEEDLTKILLSGEVTETGVNFKYESGEGDDVKTLNLNPRQMSNLIKAHYQRDAETFQKLKLAVDKAKEENMAAHSAYSSLQAEIKAQNSKKRQLGRRPSYTVSYYNSYK